MRFKKLSVCASASLVLAGVGIPMTLASSTAGASAKKAPVQILVTTPISATGLVANAEMTLDAIKASVKVLNARGGILGHQVVVTYKDDAANPTTAVTELQAAIHGGHKPLAYINGGPSQTAAAVLPIAGRSKVLTFNIGPTANSSVAKTFPYNFDLSPSTPNYASAFCPYVKAHGGTSVGIIYGVDPYGSALSAMMNTSCVAAGIKVVGIQSFADTDIDMTPQLLALQALKPSYLLFEGYGAPVGYVLQDLTKIGWSVPILGDTAVAASSNVIGVPPAQGGLLCTPNVANLKFLVFNSTVYSKSQPANLNTMIANINFYSNNHDPASLIFGYQYDSLQLIAAAAKQANSIDPTKIAKALEKLKKGSAKTGVFANYFFNKSVHAPNEPPAAFNFASPSYLVNGQYDAPGSGC
jgi:branched-chain amino acid transport system substrate-binding protein